MNIRKYITMLFCRIIIPMFDNVPDKANDVARNTTMLVFTSEVLFLKNFKNPGWNNLVVRYKYNRFSKETTRPIGFGESTNNGLYQKVKNLNASG